ncbi:DUF1214 domain-containing protein [Nocardia fluminea]|uniref:DUF1254 domain-containing protein n=1 Tax=Nocardia fluminea TaxID=134984 RepID=UPI0033D0F7BC
MASVFEREENAYTLAVQAGLWGYPLAHRVESWPQALQVKGLGHNYFHRFEHLKTAQDRFVVTPNNLTIDAYTLTDTRFGPVVFSVPQFREPRWSIVQIGDAFDDVVHNIGGIKGAQPGIYLLVGPDFQGPAPAGMPVVRMRTTCGFAAVRVQVRGQHDLPAAVEALRGFRVLPLRTFLETGLSCSGENYEPFDLPPLSAPEELAFFDRLGTGMRFLLPTHLDTTDTFVQALATIGLSVAYGFDWQDLDESVRAGLIRASATIEQITDERWTSLGHTVNGWRGNLSGGRCSYDFALNAANTKYQVGTELAEEVVYLNCGVDADGQPLDGEHTYRLHFEPGATPPVTGMWNLAMYAPDMLFVANDIDRFSIGDTTDGLRPDPDGSLTIHLRHTAPEDPAEQANWLPAPAGPFNTTMRFYAPLPTVLDGSYRLPPICKT